MASNFRFIVKPAHLNNKIHVVFGVRPSRRRQEIQRYVVRLDVQFDGVRKGRAPHSGLCPARRRHLSVLVRSRGAIRQGSLARGHPPLRR